MPEEKITATEARQATVLPRAMVLVLFASLFLCLMAGPGLALGWFSRPSLPQQRGPTLALACEVLAPYWVPQKEARRGWGAAPGWGLESAGYGGPALLQSTTLA